MESLKTTWPNNLFPGKEVRAIPEIMLIPLYHKIRIPLDVILENIKSFNNIIVKLASLYSKDLDFLEWDIFLTTVNKFKEDILDNEVLSTSYKQEILCDKFSKYIWVARGLEDNEPIIDLLFDATDIKQGKLFIRPIEYNSVFANVLKLFASKIDIENISQGANHYIFKWFK